MTTPAQGTIPPNTGTPPSPTPGTPEYDQAMADKATAAGVHVGANGEPARPSPAADPPAEDRPPWLPEKFKTVEDMAKAYAELEKKQSATPAPPPATNADPAKQTVSDAGLDWDALENEYATAGGLSEASLKALSEKGIPQNVVDSYIAGRKAEAAAYESKAFEVAGGKDQFTAMQEWAKTGMSAEQLSAYNDQVNSGNVHTMSLAVSALKSLYAAHKGPTVLQGGTSVAATGDSFKSSKEVSKAVRDPRYKSDPAFRKEVEQKIARSQF